MKKLPVTVLSGFWEAGKTTLLNHVLHNKQNLKAAVIVNDMSEINVDARLVREQNTLSRTEEKLVELSNGCICCTLREDLMIEVEKLANRGSFPVGGLDSGTTKRKIGEGPHARNGRVQHLLVRLPRPPAVPPGPVLDVSE